MWEVDAYFRITVLPHILLYSVEFRLILTACMSSCFRRDLSIIIYSINKPQRKDTTCFQVSFNNEERCEWFFFDDHLIPYESYGSYIYFFPKSPDLPINDGRHRWQARQTTIGRPTNDLLPLHDSPPVCQSFRHTGIRHQLYHGCEIPLSKSSNWISLDGLLLISSFLNFLESSRSDALNHVEGVGCNTGIYEHVVYWLCSAIQPLTQSFLRIQTVTRYLPSSELTKIAIAWSISLTYSYLE